MSDVEISAETKEFIFQFIDSVEQLEILLLLSADPQRVWSAADLFASLCSNLNSIEKRLAILHWYKLISKNDQGYFFRPEDPAKEKVIRGLAQSYRVHRYRILEMIFSPLKKSRDFAEAFVLHPSKDQKGDSNG